MNEGLQLMSEQTEFSGAAAASAEKATNFLESIKSFLKPDNLLAKFHEWKHTLLDWGIYAGVGFVVGFLLKKYLKYILLLVLFVVALVLLEQFEIIKTNINWEKMQELFGIKSVSEAFDPRLMKSYLDWVKLNFALVLCASIGFICGLKLG